MKLSGHIRYGAGGGNLRHMFVYDLAGKKISDGFVGGFLVILPGKELHHIVSVQALRLQDGDLPFLARLVKQPVSDGRGRSVIRSLFGQAALFLSAVGILLGFIRVFHAEILKVLSRIQTGGHLICPDLQLVHGGGDLLLRHAGLFLCGFRFLRSGSLRRGLFGSSRLFCGGSLLCRGFLGSVLIFHFKIEAPVGYRVIDVLIFFIIGSDLLRRGLVLFHQMVVIGVGQHVFLNDGLHSGLRRVLAVQHGIIIVLCNGSGFRLGGHLRLISGKIFRTVIFEAALLRLVHHCLDLLQLRYGGLVEIVLPGHVLIAGIGLPIQRHGGIQSHNGRIGAVHAEIIVVGIAEIIVVFQPGHVMPPDLKISLVQHLVSAVKRCGERKNDRHSDRCQDHNADDPEAQPGSAFLFLFFFSFFHAAVVAGYDLVALFLCLLFLRHVSFLLAFLQTVYYTFRNASTGK